MRRIGRFVIALSIAASACVEYEGPTSTGAIIVGGLYDAGTVLDGGSTDGGSDLLPDGGTYSNSVSGTVQGTALSVSTASSLDCSQDGMNAGCTTGDAFVELANEAGASCTYLTSGILPSGGTVLSFYVVATNGAASAIAVTPGTYTITTSSITPPGAMIASATFTHYDSTCSSLVTATATSGTISVASVNLTSGGGIEGEFSLTFTTDTITGQFNAPYCSGTVQTQNLTCG